MSTGTGRRQRSPAAFAAPLLGAAMLGALAGCGILDDSPPCPRVSVLQQARVLTLYGEGPGREEADVAFEVELREASERCDYAIDEDGSGSVEVAFSLPIRATRGPAATADSVSAPYFVALTDGGRRIVAKEIFTAEIAFDDEATGAETVEYVAQWIPLRPGESALAYETLIGIQYTEAQLEEAKRRQAR